MNRPHWQTVEVRRGDEVFTRPERLTLLFHWLRGEANPNCSYVHGESHQHVLTDPMAVNWSSFPLEEAIHFIWV